MASSFIKNNMIHSVPKDGYNVIAPPPPALTDALYEFARTPPGRDVMGYARDSGSKQPFPYDPTLEGPAAVKLSEGVIRYNWRT